MDVINDFYSMVPFIEYIVHRKCTPDWKLGKTRMKLNNIIAVYDGKVKVISNGNEYTAFNGDIVLFKENDIREAVTYPDNLMKCYAVNFSYACPLYSDGVFVNKKPALPFDTVFHIKESYRFSYIINCFRSLNNIWNRNSNENSFELRNKFMEIMECLFKEKYEDKIKNRNNIRIEKAVSFITNNIDSAIYIDEIADSAGISVSQLIRIFKKEKNMKPFEFVQKIRIKTALRYIEEGFSLKETAYKTGFCDEYYFSKVFKKIEGIAPGQYREQIKQQV